MTEPRSPRAFLTAEWRRLALVTFAVPDDVVAPILPPGTEPDRWNGSALASVVAFEFVDTAVLGMPAFFFRHFPEWNLRTYVRELAPGTRRGVTFVRELVASRLVAGIARASYGEPYSAVPYRLERHPLGASEAVAHEVEVGGRVHRLAFVAGGEPFVPAETSLEHFLKEQEWGFGPARKNGRSTLYRVSHPRWAVYPETRIDLDASLRILYGERWAFLDAAIPISKMVAVGSRIEVGIKER